MRGSAESYRVFVRNWWRWEYRDVGSHHAETHRPGPLSRKAEFERE
jgi:hypothetical protein